ncbi:MAG: hypothetical protein GVY23_08720, partial [Spirochaetes bacterium]|nr:hypothetical protein [Spirochaetota bacterium]
MHRLLSGGGVRLAVVLVALASLVGCSNTPEEPETRTQLILGTTVTIRIYEAATDAAFER